MEIEPSASDHPPKTMTATINYGRHRRGKGGVDDSSYTTQSIGPTKDIATDVEKIESADNDFANHPGEQGSSHQDKRSPTSHQWRKIVVVKITSNPFFNFRNLFRYCGRSRICRQDAFSFSMVASRRWRSMTEREKSPFRKLAEICSQGKHTYFVNIEIPLVRQKIKKLSPGVRDKEQSSFRRQRVASASGRYGHSRGCRSKDHSQCSRHRTTESASTTESTTISTSIENSTESSTSTQFLLASPSHHRIRILDSATHSQTITSGVSLSNEIPLFLSHDIKKPRPNVNKSDDSDDCEINNNKTIYDSIKKKRTNDLMKKTLSNSKRSNNRSTGSSTKNCNKNGIKYINVVCNKRQHRRRLPPPFPVVEEAKSDVVEISSPNQNFDKIEKKNHSNKSAHRCRIHNNNNNNNNNNNSKIVDSDLGESLAEVPEPTLKVVAQSNVSINNNDPEKSYFADYQTKHSVDRKLVSKS